MGFEGLGSCTSAALFCPEVSVEHVAITMRGGFFFRDGARVEQCLRQRMVRCQLFELSVAEQIDPAVTDATDPELASDLDGKHDGRAHVAVVGLDFAEGHDFRIGVFDRLVDLVNNLPFRLIAEVEQLVELLRNELDRNRTRFLSGALSAHAISDDEEARLFIDEERVFVIVSKFPGDADAPGSKLEHCGFTEK